MEDCKVYCVTAISPIDGLRYPITNRLTAGEAQAAISKHKQRTAWKKLRVEVYQMQLYLEFEQE